MVAVRLLAVMAPVVAMALTVAAFIAAFDSFFTGAVVAIILTGVEDSLEGGFLLHRGG